MVKSKNDDAVDDVIVTPEVSHKATAKQQLEKFIEEETKLVRGRFRFLECPGGSQEFHCSKYKGVPDFKKLMTDGCVYEIPLWMARHLNGTDITAGACGGKINSCAYPIHAHYLENGKFPENTTGEPPPMTRIGKWNQRFAFESLEFGSAF